MIISTLHMEKRAGLQPSHRELLRTKHSQSFNKALHEDCNAFYNNISILALVICKIPRRPEPILNEGISSSRMHQNLSKQQTQSLMTLH